MGNGSGGRGADAARATAVAAADRAGVRIVEVLDGPRMRDAAHVVAVLGERGTGSPPLVDPEALLDVSPAGGLVFVAFRDDEPVGVTVASLEPGSDGEPSLRSHVSGAIDDPAGAVATALRWHQRAWCLEQGIVRVRWTFDPLVRSDAVASLVELGARAVGYLDNADLLAVDWELTAPRVEAAAAGRAAAPDVAALRRAGAQPAVTADPSGAPVVTPTAVERRLVQIPDDIGAIRATDPELARSWTMAIRTALSEPLQTGFRVSGMTRDGWYVLAADRQVAELADRR